MNRFVLNLCLSILPATRLFSLKRLLCRLSNIDVGKKTCICGGVKFYGRGHIEIGQNCWIGLNTKFYTSATSSIIIGSKVDIAPETIFHTGSHEIGDAERRAGNGYSLDIKIGNGVWIGLRTTILAGVSIPNGCILAAGTVVLNREWQINSFLAGIPAKQKGNYRE